MDFDDALALPKMVTKVVFHFKANPDGINFDDALPSSTRPWSVKNGYDFAAAVLSAMNTDGRVVGNYDMQNPLSANVVLEEDNFDFEYAYSQAQSVFFYNQNEQITNDPDALNIRFEGQTLSANGTFVTTGDASRQNRITLRNAQIRVVGEIDTPPDPITSYARIALHEHGHTLYLNHTFNILNPCNNIAFDCNNEICGNACVTNDAGGNAYGCSWLMMAYSGAQNRLTPCELALMWNDYYNAEDSYRSLECEPQVERELIIATDDVWDTRHIVDADIIIRPGARLTINCEVLMGEGRRIIVESGGQLLVDGGVVTSLCSEPWEGVKVYGGFTAPQGVPVFDVKFTNLAVIENTSDAAVSMFAEDTYSNPPVFGNGILHADNTTFNNVRRLAELMAWSPSANGSYVRGCTQNGGKWGVTNWNCLNVEVSGSTFDDITNEAIVSSTGEMWIDNNTIRSGNADILLTNHTPGFGCVVTNNIFEGTSTGVRGLGTGYDLHDINSNQFLTGEFDIFMDGDNYYEVWKNDITSDFGVTSINNGNASNNVHKNTIAGSIAGLIPAGDNGDYNFYENCFSTSVIDVHIEGDIADYVAKSSTEAANNCFTHQGVVTSLIDDMNGNPDPFKYIEPNDGVSDCLDGVKAHPNIDINELNFPEKDPCGTSGTGNAIPTNPFTPCHPIRPSKNGSNIIDAIADIEARILATQTDLSLTSAQRARYIAFYRRCLSKVKRYWYAVLIEQGRYQELRTELLAEGTDDALILAFASYIQENDLAAARTFLLSWSSPSNALADFRATQLINLDRLPYGKFYQASASELSQVRLLADREHPYAAYAKALYYDLTGEILSSDLPAMLRQHTTPRSQKPSKVVSFDVYPNPTTEAITIAASKAGAYSVEVVDATGRVVSKDNLLTGSDLTFDIVDNGIYFVRIFDGANPVHHEKIVVIK